MKDVYVHTLRYRYSGRGNRQSRTMFPISYGPFQDEESAREWIRQSGLTRATTLVHGPARENVKVAPTTLAIEKDAEHRGIILRRIQQNTVSSG